MNRSGTSRFWIIAAIVAGATINLASGQAVSVCNYYK